MPAAFSFSCERQRLIVESATEIRRLRLPGFARQLVRHLTSKRVIGSRFLSDDSRREFHLLGDRPILSCLRHNAGMYPAISGQATPGAALIRDSYFTASSFGECHSLRRDPVRHRAPSRFSLSRCASKAEGYKSRPRPEAVRQLVDLRLKKK